MGWGSSAFGISPWGGNPVAAAAPVVLRELGDFGFQVLARTIGGILRVYFTVPAFSEAPNWDRHLIILRKQGEWPRSWNDADAWVSIDDWFPVGTEGDYYFEEANVDAGTIYYYALFTLRDDGVWINDTGTGRDSAYPYDRWGFTDYMFDTLPRGYRSEDAAVGHLYQFLSVLGALLDNAKTDVEQLLSLFCIDEIHVDLLPLLDAKIGWPTWAAAPGLQQRQETANAVAIYKLLGRADAYEALLEEASDWDTTVVEGWRYVMFSNGVFGSTTPDFSDPLEVKFMGRISDRLKYTNDCTGWHAVTGLGLFLSEIPGVSGALTGEILDRCGFLIEWAKASYVTTSLIATTLHEESTDLGDIDEDWEEWLISLETELWPIETDLGYTTTSWTMFYSLEPDSTTNTIDDRTYHSAIVIPPP